MKNLLPFDKHRAAAPQRESMMDGRGTSKKQKKRGDKKANKKRRSLSLTLSVTLALKIDCDSSRTYERCDHIMDHSIGRQ